MATFHSLCAIFLLHALHTLVANYVPGTAAPRSDWKETGWLLGVCDVVVARNQSADGCISSGGACGGGDGAEL